MVDEDGDTVGEDGRVDFFVSHAGPDRAWAIWIDAELRGAGFSTITDVYDFRPGQNFVLKMNDALDRADQVLLLASPQVVDRWMVESEWTAAIAAGPERLVPVKVEACELPEILRPILHIDLTVHGADGEAAAATLIGSLQGVERPGAGEAVRFPGSASPAAGRFPARGSLVWSALIPPRDPFFTGRADQLAVLETGLDATESVALVQAVEGLGGVGKSALAIEHCYRSRASVDVVWWVRAEQPEVAYADMARLAPDLGVAVSDASLEEQAALVRDALARTDWRWLLVLDNVEDGEVLDVLRPTAGGGRVVITARKLPAAVHVGRVDVDVWPPGDALEFLQRHLPDVDVEELAVLAERLGWLALALEQAAAYLADTGTPVVEYLDMLANEGLGAGDDLAAHRTVMSVFRTSIARAVDVNPDAGRVMEIIGFLAPELIPRAVFTDAAQRKLLGVNRVADLNSAIAALARLGLIETAPDGVKAHRLVQEVSRELTDAPSDAIERAAASLLAYTPGETIPECWSIWEAVLPHILVVLDHAEQHDSHTSPSISLQLWTGTYLAARGTFAAALDQTQQAAEHATRLFGPGHPDTLRYGNSLAIRYGQVGRVDEALVLAEQVLADHERMLGHGHPDTLRARSNLAIRYSEVGRVDEALALAEHVLADRERVLGPDHPDTLTARHNLAGLYGDVGRVDEALALAEQVLADSERVLGPDHPDTLSTRYNLAGSYGDVGRVDEAVVLTEQVLADSERVLGPDHPDTVLTRNRLAVWYVKEGRVDEALALTEQVITDFERVLGPDHPHTIGTRSNLAIRYSEVGRVDEALALAEQVLADRERVLGPNHPNTVASRELLVWLHGRSSE